VGSIASAPALPGLEGYEVLRELGHGAMGRVYLARQVSLGREVAVKGLRGASTGGGAAVERFRREGRALARMSHDNVVAVYDMVVNGDDAFLVMEYVDGPTVGRLLRGHTLTRPQALHVVGDIASALAYASSQGIIHRDLKPENVLVDGAGVCKVADFGLAKLLSGQAAFATQVGAVMGTPAYMSPEQAMGRPDIDERTDVYSLGVLAYELMVGQLPFPDAADEVQMLEAHVRSDVPAPSSVVKGFPRQLEAALLKALAKDPRRRYQSAGAFWKDLSAAADREVPGWRGDGDLMTLVAATRPGGRQTRGAFETNAAPLETMAASDTIAPAETLAPTETLALTDTLAPAETLAPMDTIAPNLQTSMRTLAPVQRSMPTLQKTNASLARPQTRSSVSGRSVVTLVSVLALVVAAAAGGYLVYTRLGRSTPAPAVVTTLQVREVTAALESGTPAAGHCPRATFSFAAHLHTNGGAGRVVYRWVGPDGSAGPDTTVAVQDGQSDVLTRFEYSYSGNHAQSGAARLEVVSPSTVASSAVPVTYRCP
jgi:serine/threonine protein kinase